MQLPPMWQEAFRRDAVSKPALADPLPERRLARLLGAFLASGLVFLVAPGTLLGVWNLIGIASRRSAASVSPVWIQGHGHAQLFGWVASFMIGISLYSVPKFRGGALRSLALGWAMWAVWTAAVAARWASALGDWHWRAVWPAASAAEFAVAALLLWQCAVPARTTGLWNRLVFTGLAGFAGTMAWQLFAIFPAGAEPLIPEPRDRVLLWMALWTFTFPVAWGFSVRFLPAFLGLKKPGGRAVDAGLVSLAAAAVLEIAAGANPGWARLAACSAWLTLAAAAAACWSLRIFQKPQRKPKTAGVDPRYPIFVRLAFGWLLASALLACIGGSRGWVGASRHAFTVGFLATLIFAIGPRILPSFVNSRELWSKRLMLTALVLLSAGCALRVALEPPAYAGAAAAAWRLLPVSAILELAAVVVFALNLGVTLAAPFPAWIERESITADLPLYWFVTAYPRTRGILERAGLRSLAHVRNAPKSLTLREAAQADGADEGRPIEALR
ncbi:MAG: NnrS family protein, partial [Acidobacteriia bacterium]|nr:NnrS family protein [Terriglobia bacterium]